jgi:hypothetical protein
MPGQRGASGSGQQTETIIQTGRDMLNAQRGCTRCRKLDGERYAVEMLTDCDDC